MKTKSKRVNPKVAGNPINPAFKFWIENKISNEREFFISDIRQLFQKWLVRRDKEWLQYYGCFQVVVSFIGSKDGMNAVNEQQDLDELVRLLKPDYLKALS